MRRRAFPCVVALFLAGCLGPGPTTVVISETADARLKTAVKHGLFLTNARVGGLDAGPFLIDTGASDLIFDVKLAKTLNLRFWGESDDTDTRQRVKYGTVASVEVGPVALRNTRAVVMDLSAVTDAFGGRLAGVLGYPFFTKAIVEVDYAKQSVRCFDPKTYRLPRGAWQPLTLRGPHPGVAARLEGNAEGTFLLDTGSTHSVHFFREFVEKNRLLEIRRISQARLLRVSGEHDMFAGRISWFDLAGHWFENPTISFSAPGTPATAVSRQFDGIIGYDFLREFVVVFNYPASQIALWRR